MCQVVEKLIIENVLYGRVKGNIDEIKSFHKRLVKIINDNGAKNINGSIKRIIYSDIINDEHIVDLEIWVPLNKKIESTDEFSFLDKFELYNFILVEYKGSPEKSGDVSKQIQEYIEKEGLTPLPPAYNHSMHVASESTKQEDMFFRIYLKVS